MALLVAFFAAVIGVIARLLQLRQRERRLSDASIAQYRSLFENNPSPMFLYDLRSLEIVSVNLAALDLFGYTAAEFARLTVLDLVVPELAEQVTRQVAALDPLVHDDVLMRMRRKDGSVMDVDTRGRPADIEGHTARLVMVLDITERIAAERAVHSAAQEAREARDVLRSLIDVAPHAIIAMDSDYRVTIWNNAATALFGWTEDEVIGKPLPYMRPEQADDFAARRRLALEEGVIPPMEATRMRKDGSIIDVLTASAILRGTDGSTVGYIGIFTDLTERKLLEQQLRQSQKMEAVGRLSGGIAHDFNNILTVITSYATMLLDDHRADADTESLREISAAARRAAALTRQLLSFSRNQMLQLSPLNVNRVVGDMEPMLRRIVPENIRVSTSLQSDLGVALADGGQLEQVIMNLVVNAVDAMPDGGLLKLETGNVDLDDEYVRVHPDVVAGPHIMLAASDTGIGMDAATLNRIFEPFFTTKSVGRGTGIGLATTYAIVKQFGGHIWVYSEPGSGSTFKIYLPRSSAAAVVEQDAPPVSSRVGRNGSILLVEDDTAVRRSIRGMLVRHGYEVLEAVDGESGLALIGSHEGTIDTVVTDLMMPGMNGTALAAALATTHPGLHVVFTSGYTDDEVVRRGLVTHGHTFLQKPFTSEQLLRAIDSSA